MRREPGANRDDVLLAYYLLQYDRIAAHESTRLQMTNFVLSGSVVALGVMAVAEADALLRVGTLVLVAVTNLLAAVHAQQSRRWVKLHQERARQTARRLVGNEIRSIQKAAAGKSHLAAPARARNLNTRQANLVIVMHSLVALFAVVLAAVSVR